MKSALHHDAGTGRRRGEGHQAKILYPYHFGSTDTGALTKLLANDKKIEVRIRNLQ
jgi:hypothetical protein